MDFLNTPPPCVAMLGLAGMGSENQAAIPCGNGCESSACTHCTQRAHVAKQHLFTHGDAQRYIYYVHAGCLRLYKTLGNGRRQVIGFSFAGDFIGFGIGPEFPYNAQSIGRSEVRCLPRGTFHRLALEIPRFAFRLYEATTLELAAAHDLALTIGQRNSAAAVASFLLWLSRRNERRGVEPTTISLPMPRTDIADYLGLTGETVSRTFTRLKVGGLIRVTRKRLVQLTDMPALLELAEGMAGEHAGYRHSDGPRRTPH